jgi:hypothetical protein
MSGTISILRDILRSHPESSHCILVISDGQVDDQSQTVSEATRAVRDLVAKAPIHTTLIRLKTNHYGSPDTRALACVGSFCNQGQAPVVDVDTAQPDVALVNLTEVILDGLFQSGGRLVNLTATKGTFRRLPTAEGFTTVQIPCGVTSYFLLSPDGDDSIILNGEAVPINIRGPPDSPETLRAFFDFVEQQLRMWQVMGSRQDEIQQIVDWVAQLQTFLDSLQSQAVEQVDLSTLGRARAVKRGKNLFTLRGSFCAKGAHTTESANEKGQLFKNEPVAFWIEFVS